MKGFFGIGIINGKTEANTGMLLRSAGILGASFIFTIGTRYKKARYRGDTPNTPGSLPFYEYLTWEDFKNNLPLRCELVAVELSDDSQPLKEFSHPKRACYLLGAEDSGIPEDYLTQANHIVQLPGKYSLNVAVAGSIVMFDRFSKS